MVSVRRVARARRVPVVRPEWNPIDSAAMVEWKRHADRLWRKWSLPPVVSSEDLLQELLMAAWHFHRLWDPDGGIPHRVWVFTGAINRAKSWIHAQRGALRRSAYNPSRYHVSAGEDGVQDSVQQEAIQHRVVEVSMRIEDLINRSPDERSLACAKALRDHVGNFEAAARKISEPSERLRLRIDSKKHARAVLRRFARQAIEAAAD